MRHLLLELFSEEIPARMQPAAAEQLERMLREALTEAQLTPSALHTYVTPRRLTIAAEGIPNKQPDNTEERRGPKLGAPQKAIDGFLTSTGLTMDQLEVRVAGKDEYYFATIDHVGKPAGDIIKPMIERILADFHWPKSMRWADNEIRWVRPLKNILCLLDSTVIPVEFGHLTASNITYGHRFLAPQEITISSYNGYLDAMHNAYVMLSAEDRKESILRQAAEITDSNELVLKHDIGLLEEVAGLIEWPTVFMGQFDPDFMAVPPEALTSEMRAHQKYFSLTYPDGTLAPYFLLVSNMLPQDGGAQIIIGNERVLRARLSDARFFWDQDRQKSLDDHASKLGQVVFHAELGTVADKVERISSMAKFLSVWIPHANLQEVQRAANLCKADLTSEMVGEFPNLQGIMGRYYATEQGEPKSIADAIGEHYSPQGPSDAVPNAPISIALALADKTDTLAGLFAANEKPTGSKDPFALRRAALGVIRIILENQLRIPLSLLLETALSKQPKSVFKPREKGDNKPSKQKHSCLSDLLAFFEDRLKYMLKDKGYHHDHITAVFDGGSEDDLFRLVQRVDALSSFLSSTNGADLLAAYRRANNILRKEEKKDNTSYAGEASPNLLEQAEEIALHGALSNILPAIKTALKEERYADMMNSLSTLRDPLDRFFETVTVNCENPKTRQNRLRLLSQIRHSLDQVANFNVIES